MTQESTYHLTVVGLGPGDPELVTMKGIRAIQAADLIFTPRTRPDEASRALRIAQPWIDSTRQQVVPLTIPMERDQALATAAYQETASEILERLQTHPHTPVRAVYLLLGDPLLYGTFTNLRNALLHAEPGLAVTIIPGVTSFAATAAQVALPLSSGNERVAILPAPEDVDELRALFTAFNTLILMKVGRHLPAIIATLSAMNLLDQAVYAERIGMPEERVVRDLASLRDYEAPYLSLLIVRRTRDSS